MPGVAKQPLRHGPVGAQPGRPGGRWTGAQRSLWNPGALSPGLSNLPARWSTGFNLYTFRDGELTTSW